MGLYGFINLYAAITLIIAPFYFYVNKSLDASFLGMVCIITSLVFVALISQVLNRTSKQEETKEEDEEQEEKETEDFEEIFEDDVYDIRESMQTYKEESLQEETEFFSQIEGLLQDIEYIQRFGQVEEDEEEEVYKNISSHLYHLLSSYVLLQKENRKQVIHEFLPVVQEKRSVLYHTYIETHQKGLLQDCQSHGERLKEKKKEYMYMQE